MTDRIQLILKPRLLARLLLVASLAVISSAGLAHSDATAFVDSKDNVLLTTLREELQRASAALAKASPAAYFISYAVHDQETTTLIASLGSLMTSANSHRRLVDVTVRVGDPSFDNTHGMALPALQSGMLSLGEDRDAISRQLWQLTDEAYKRAASAYTTLKAGSAVRAEEEDKSPDFSQEQPHVSTNLSQAPPLPELKTWQERVRRYSAAFLKYTDIQHSSVFFQVARTRFSFVSSEGTMIARPSWLARIVLQAETLADDGMGLSRGLVLQSATPERLPAETEIAGRVEKIAADLKALRAAPVAEPFDGPALLSGESAAVFFHEVLGHRLEGHRQRDDREGQTFTKKVNQQILPEFLAVVSDPTLKEVGGVALMGSYDFDQEGVPAQNVELVGNGILKNFLMSRRPVRGFAQSNGHGRSQPGLMPTARQSNLVVRSAKVTADSELRQKLIEEVRKQGKPYGLFFEDVTGGFTLTQRFLPQAFQLLPVLVWRVYPDGRPDELIRGVDIVGTPLTALRSIALTGETLRVFNGMCGAESGQVPVAAVAPAMLVSEIEIQKRGHSRELPPILPPPRVKMGLPGVQP